jgi:cobalt-zinc-cadmium efflux system protein
MVGVHTKGHPHEHGLVGRRLRTAFLLTLVILLVELAGGLISHSLALLSDAGHVLTDVVALGLAWFAAAQSTRPADARRTYGYHRIGILAALGNAFALLLIVLVIAYEAVQRFAHPTTVMPAVMLVSAAVGIGINLWIGLGLRREESHNLNLRAATLHVFGDVAASVGVVVGGLIILATHWYLADPLISLALALLIAWSAWNILRETVDILMEASPKDLNVAQLVHDVERLPGVEDMHDLHIWSIAGGMTALSAHVRVSDRPLSACDPLLGKLDRLLAERYAIGHTTLQLEYAGCTPSDLYCGLAPGEAAHAHHHVGAGDGGTAFPNPLPHGGSRSTASPDRRGGRSAARGRG